MSLSERYEIFEPIYNSSSVTVFRGRYRQDGTRVLLKVQRSTAARPKLRDEYAVYLQLNLLGVVPVRNLEEHGSEIALVFDDLGGETLASRLARGPLPLAEGLRIAAELADTLGQIHHHRVIHKDINPTNILLDEGGNTRIFDFDLSTRLPRELQSIRTPNLLVGTLSYISPEQTGRMNRAIDHRTDLYSLGVTLYEMLTGHVPFPASDPMELVYCHIAQTAPPPAELDPALPEVVSDIVMKLLEKTAEARYQTAFGLKADLEECSWRLAENGCIDPFPLGTRDVSDRFHIPQKLYGRGGEIAALESAFASSAQGTPGFALVSGSSGIGKSSVIHELHRSLPRSRGVFISGKFDQLKRDIPYTALLQACSDLLRALLAEQEDQFALFRERILAAVGAAGRILTEVLPDLERIIGPQPPVPELPAAEARSRFRLIFENLLHVFTRHGRPLVLFLDDLQWADEATLDLLPALLGNVQAGALFIIGAYRDNEVLASHPLLSTIAAIERGGVRPTRLSLEPITSAQVTDLIADTLALGESEAQPLAELVWRRTLGNPLFTGELLTMLHKEGLIEFDPARHAWTFDLALIERSKMTDNVGQLMAARAAALSQRAQEVLQLGAVLGSGFDLAMLSLVAERSPEQTKSELEEALQDGLLFGTGQGEHDGYRFVHDRVQQAVYASIPEDERLLVHHRAGMLLWRGRPHDDKDESLFELLSHLNLSSSEVRDSDERIALSKLNLTAAKRARAAGALAAATNHYAAGINFLPEGAWASHHGLLFTMHFGQAECEYMSTHYAAAERIVKILLKQETCTSFERAQVYELLSLHKVHVNQHGEAIEAGRKALDLVGFPLSRTPPSARLLPDIVKTRRALRGRSPAELTKLPDTTDPRVLLACRVLVVMSSSAFVIADTSLWMTLGLKVLRLGLEHGNSPYNGYNAYGSMLMKILGDYAGAEAWGRLALDQAERYQNKALIARTKAVYGFMIHPWRHPFKESIRYQEEAVQAGVLAGQFTHAGYPVGHLALLHLTMGCQLDLVRQVARESLEFAQRVKHDVATNHSHTTQQTACALQGLTRETGSFTTSEFDESAFADKLMASGVTSINLSHYTTYKLMVLYLLDRHDEALAISEVVRERRIHSLTLDPSLADYHFYEALLLASLTVGKGALARQRDLLRIRVHLHKLKRWAENAPMNFRPKFVLLSAELARLTEDDRAAVGFYEEAIALAREHELMHDEAIALELAGQFHRSRGLPDVAITYLARARQAYARWGAHAKVALLDQAYPGLAARTTGERRSVPPPNAVTSTSTSVTTTAGMLDIPSMIKASQALSSEISLDKLLLRLMQVVAENAGAERGVLVLQRQGVLAVAAEFTVRGGARLPERPVPIVDSESLSPGIVTYVFRSRNAIVLNDASTEGQFTADPYVVRRKPKAILCAPLCQKSEVNGVLYLENNLVSGAFTDERAELFSVLCAQMAISIENAYLYADLELKVIERTRALREAQARLVQLEKEATEIQMAGGFAHEMRNALAGAGMALSAIYRSAAASDAWSACAENSGRLLELVLRVKAEVSAPTFHDVTDIAMEMNKVEERIEIALGLIDRAIRRGLRITGLILDYSRISQTPAGADAVPVTELVNKVLDPLKDDFAAHRISVDVEIPAGCMFIGNELHFGTILQQLVNNARDALCEMKDSNGRAIQIRVVDEPTRLVLSVSDTGMGILPELHDTIFQPFFSTKPATGTGLGLGMTRKFASLYGGVVEVDSVPQHGSTFRVVLPKERLPAALSAAAGS